MIWSTFRHGLFCTWYRVCSFRTVLLLKMLYTSKFACTFLLSPNLKIRLKRISSCLMRSPYSDPMLTFGMFGMRSIATVWEQVGAVWLGQVERCRPSEP